MSGGGISGLIKSVSSIVSTVAKITGNLSMLAFDIVGSMFGENQEYNAGHAKMMVNTASNLDPIVVVYGIRRTGGSRVLCEVSGTSNEYLHIVLVVAESEIEEIGNVYIDDLISTNIKFSGFVTIEKHLGADNQAASSGLLTNLPTKWTANHKGSGIAYLYIRLKYSTKAFPRGLPVITCDLKGRKVYNAKTGLTEWTDNPAWCIRDYLTNTRYGRALPESYIDDASFIVAADYCDELVSVPSGTQKRYTCNGFVNVNNSVFTNIQSLLTSCMGVLKYVGGKYKLVIDKPETPSFVFSEDNIIGNWVVKQGGRKDKYNKVVATFFNPNMRWQEDSAIQQSLTYTVEDGGRVCEKKISLPFTANYYMACHMAQIEMKRSRFGLAVQFTATQEAIRCETGDVVSVTHATTGWVAKPFRVAALEIKENDEVAVTLREYDPAIYTLDALVVEPTVGVSNLPDPFATGICTNLDAVEVLYQTLGSAGVKARVDVTWTPPDYSNVSSYILQYRTLGSSIWDYEVGGITTNKTSLFDMAIGQYEMRVAYINTFNAISDYSDIITTSVFGTTQVPEDMTGLNSVAVNGFAYIQWDKTTSLDVKIGGYVEIRHSILTVGANWTDGRIIQVENGDATNAVVPLIDGTYMTKFVDSTGHYSTNAASFLVGENLIAGWTTVADIVEHPTFSGSKTQCTASDGELFIGGTTLIADELSLVSTWLDVRSLGGVYPSATYDFTNVQDFTTVATRRFHAHIKSLAYNTVDLISTRGLISTWSKVSGGDADKVSVKLYASTTNDDPAGTPTWSAYSAFDVADYTCRAIKFRLQLTSSDPINDIAISELSVKARIPA